MKRKLASSGLAFALAELFAAYLPPLVFLPAAALFGLLYFFNRKERIGLLFFGALCGVAYFGIFYFVVVRPVQMRAGQCATCMVTVQTDAEPSYQEGMSRGTLQITEWNGQAVNFQVTCSAFPSSSPGDRFSAKFQFSRLDSDSYQKTYQSKGIYLQAEYLGFYQSLQPVNDLQTILFRFRQILSRKLRLWMPETEGRLEAAMLLGEKDDLPDSIRDSFRAAGVSHLLAVSGLHVTLLCGIFSLGFRRRFVRSLILLRGCLVVFYMLLTGMPISVMRAGLVFLLALLGDFFLQPVDLLTSTGAAAIFLGLQNAYAPCDIGFQLSFCAVIGVQLSESIIQWEYEHFPQIKHPHLDRIASGAFVLLENVQVAFFASLATLPVLVAQGLSTSGVSVLTNLLVVWMMELSLQLGLVTLALSLVPLLEPVMQMSSLLLSIWLRAMISIVTWCSELPLAKLPLPQDYTLLVLAVLFVLALLFWYWHKIIWYVPAAILCTVFAVAAGAWSQQDVVRITLVGASNNPCIVCEQNGAAFVLFRGGQTNLNAVMDFWAERGEPNIVRFIDLRQKPSSLDFSSYAVTQMEELDGYYCWNMLDDVVLDLYHDSQGNLAVLGIGGYHIAASTGEVQLSAPIEVDVFCAAGNLPKMISPHAIVTCSNAPAWLNQIAGQTVYYGAETPSVVIRPHASITFEEVGTLAL